MSQPSQVDTPSPWSFVRSNLLIWIGLIVLIGASCGLAYAPLEPVRLPILLLITAIEVAGVAVFSMGLRHANALIRVTVLLAALILFVMFALTSADVVTRFAHHWTR